MRLGVAYGLVGVLALSTMAAACGDDDDGGSGGGGAVSAEAKPYVDELRKSMMADGQELQLTSSQADCMAPKFIDAIGVDTLKAKGVKPEDMASDSDMDFDELALTDAQGTELVDSFSACDVSLKALFIDSLSSDSEISADDKKCVEDALPDELVERLMVTTFTKGSDALQQDEDLMGQMLGVFSKCPGAVPDS